MLEIRQLRGTEGRQQLSSLADVLLDCVEGGASVSFMAPFSKAAAETFFEGVLDDVESGDRILLAAFLDSKLIGTVQIVTAMSPNQPHRAEVTNYSFCDPLAGKVSESILWNTWKSAHAM